MRLRHGLAIGLSIGLLIGAPSFVLAQDAPAADQPGDAAPGKDAARQKPEQRLPQACVTAGVTTEADCRALLEQQKAEKSGADKAAADKAAEEKAAADRAAADKAASEKAANEKAAADKAAADKAAAEPKASPAPADENAPPVRNRRNGKPPAVEAAPNDEAAPAAETAPPANPPRHRNNQNGRKPAPEAVPAPETAAPAAEQPEAAPQPENAQPSKHRQEHPALAEDCVAAGIQSEKDCDAVHAKAKQPPKQEQQPAATEPQQPAATEQQPAPAETVPAQPPRHRGEQKPTPPAENQQQPAPAGQQPAPAEQPVPNAPAAGQQPTQTPAGQVPPAAANQPKEVLPELPKGVSKDEVAPLLDSAKDVDTGKTPPEANGGRRPLPPAANVPPPTDDKAAQAQIKPEKVIPIDQAKGQAIETGTSAPQIQLPQNVTVINQTVNNTTNVQNNTTIQNNTTNVQNNNGPGVQQNNGPGQQNGRPGRPGEIGPGGPNGGPGGPGGPGWGGPPRGEPNPIGLGIQTILQIGSQLIINSPGMDQRRIANRPDDHTYYERLPGNRYRETISRPNGVKVVTIYDQYGDILQRSRFDRNGRETVLAYFDPRYDSDLSNWHDPGDDLPPLRLDIPARDYVLDADDADETDIQDFFAQPPVEHVQRLYSIDEVKRSARIRDMVRRLEVGDLTFDTGAATISEDQVGNLGNIAKAMLALLKRNPAETFLIEGHTDAVGSDAYNLVLSDQRAATVAQILTDFYHIPPENLATQGYGKRFLKVQTQGPEPLNRRVTIRRITPLVTVANQAY